MLNGEPQPNTDTKGSALVSKGLDQDGDQRNTKKALVQSLQRGMAHFRDLLEIAPEALKLEKRSQVEMAKVSRFPILIKAQKGHCLTATFASVNSTSCHPWIIDTGSIVLSEAPAPVATPISEIPTPNPKMYPSRQEWVWNLVDSTSKEGILISRKDYTRMILRSGTISMCMLIVSSERPSKMTSNLNIGVSGYQLICQNNFNFPTIEVITLGRPRTTMEVNRKNPDQRRKKSTLQQHQEPNPRTDPISVNPPNKSVFESNSPNSQIESINDLDVPIARRNDKRLKKVLASEFEIKDLESLRSFLGMEVGHAKKDSIHPSQGTPKA
ncbi:hypothetical protein CK203_089602 [Vitis vinifera]|uniref:Uncharacterized protein n=1 Tax=Vitis vinifera TaxID=29760 RepID=A0A438EYS2_VITVI|nr:hypothetical protein CK203_089602 [Vitis vinifera]